MSNLEALKAQADSLGIKYGKTISATMLQQRIDEHQATDTSTVNPPKDAPSDLVADMRMDAMRLIRCIVTPMDKAKSNYEGELFEAGNSAVNVRKFVPFGVVTHIEKILFDFIQSKTMNVFYDERSSSGRKIRKARQSNGYAIQVLPQLTQKELDDLAKAQQARQSIE